VLRPSKSALIVTMKIKLFATLSLMLILLLGSAQALAAEIPQWFLDDLEESIGTWIADNSEYKSDEEPYEKYGLEWKYGIGNTSLIGRMFAYQDGKEIGPFWQFRQYWDNESGQAVVLQFGWYGEIGAGTYRPLEDGSVEVIQNFVKPNGETRPVRHINKVADDHFSSTSFEMQDGEWVQDRSTYIWKKVEHEQG